MNENYNDSDKTSCTRDDALGIMIGVGRIRILPPKDDATPEERDMHGQINFTLQDYLYERYESLSIDYEEAKFNKLPEAVIDEELAALNKHKAEMKDAKDVAPYLDDEIAKLAHGNPSALRVDLPTSRPGVECYTYISVKECEKIIRARMHKEKKSKSEITPEQQEEQQANKKPWLIPDPRDPTTTNDWFPAARYFARQLVEAEPKLRNNRVQLAKNVSKSMAENKVYSRSGKKPPSPETIRNALVGMGEFK